MADVQQEAQIREWESLLGRRLTEEERNQVIALNPSPPVPPVSAPPPAPLTPRPPRADRGGSARRGPPLPPTLGPAEVGLNTFVDALLNPPEVQQRTGKGALSPVLPPEAGPPAPAVGPQQPVPRVAAPLAPGQVPGPQIPASLQGQLGPQAGPPISAINRLGEGLGPQDVQTGELPPEAAPELIPPAASAPAAAAPSSDVAPTGKPMASVLEKMLFDKRNKLRQLRGARSIARAGTRIAQLPTAETILTGTPPVKGIDTEDLDKQIGDLEFETSDQNDPNSPLTISLRNEYKKAGFDNVSKDATFTTLQALAPALTAKMLAKERNESREKIAKMTIVAQKEMANLRLNQQRELEWSKFIASEVQRIREEKKDVGQAKKDALGKWLSDASANTSKAALASGQQVLATIKFFEDKGTTMSTPALNINARTMVKAAGDTGKISDADVAAFITRRGLPGLIDKIELGLSGRVTEGFTEDLKEMIEITNEAHRMAIANKAKNIARSYALTGIPGLNEADVLNLFISPEELKAAEAIEAGIDAGVPPELQREFQSATEDDTQQFIQQFGQPQQAPQVQP